MRGIPGGRSRILLIGAVAATAAVALLGRALATSPRALDMVATARLEDFDVRITDHGTLRPTQALTYHSPFVGRESEILFLAPEGATVQPGDLLIRLDATELTLDAERLEQLRRQSAVQLQIAQADALEAESELASLQEGDGALALEQARTDAALADRKAKRASEEVNTLKPLLERGFVTREEFDRAALAEAEAAEGARLSSHKARVFETSTRPKAIQRAGLTLSKRRAQVEHARASLEEMDGRLAALRQALQSSSVYARSGGLVIYEEHLSTPQRRKIRVGDRVSSSQSLLTISEVRQMRVESSIREADMHRVAVGQDARVVLEAHPGVELRGRVTSVGTVARPHAERPFEGKRFDVAISLDPTSVSLRPEMTARIQIVVVPKRQALVVPVNAVFDLNGNTVVYVQRGGTTETRVVKIGDANDVFVSVLDGLRAGEVVRLTQ